MDGEGQQVDEGRGQGLDLPAERGLPGGSGRDVGAALGERGYEADEAGGDQSRPVCAEGDPEHHPASPVSAAAGSGSAPAPSSR
jgi:hypothetical protein